MTGAQIQREGLATMARDKARQAMHQGKPVEAKEWLLAAQEADPLDRALTVDLRIADELERIANALVFIAANMTKTTEERVEAFGEVPNE